MYCSVDLDMSPASGPPCILRVFAVELVVNNKNARPAMLVRRRITHHINGALLGSYCSSLASHGLAASTSRRERELQVTDQV